MAHIKLITDEYRIAIPMREYTHIENCTVYIQIRKTSQSAPCGDPGIPCIRALYSNIYAYVLYLYVTLFLFRVFLLSVSRSRIICVLGVGDSIFSMVWLKCRSFNAALSCLIINVGIFFNNSSMGEKRVTVSKYYGFEWI